MRHPHKPTAIESPQYAIVPLPDDLVQSPGRRFLWWRFIHLLTSSFLCWNPDVLSGDVNFRNPFAIILAPMALGNDAFRAAALGLSASRCVGLRCSPQMFADEACMHLVAAKHNDMTDTGARLAVIATAIFVHLFDDAGDYFNLLDLARSAAASLGRFEDLPENFQAGFEVVVGTLRWIDICTNFSLRRHVPIANERIHNLILVDDGELRYLDERAFCPLTIKSWLVQPTYAFSSRLINPLLRLSRLSRIRQNQRELMIADDSCLQTQIDELEQDFVAVRDHDRSFLRHGTTDDAALLCLNEATAAMAFMLYCTRLRDIPSHAPVITHLLTEARRHLEQIAFNSPAALGTVFPLYVMGLEALDEEIQHFVETRLAHLPGLWNGREHRLINSLRRVWALRGTMPEQPWNTWTHCLQAYSDGEEPAPI